jgi:hypothetical protein
MAAVYSLDTIRRCCQEHSLVTLADEPVLSGSVTKFLCVSKSKIFSLNPGLRQRCMAPDI